MAVPTAHAANVPATDPLQDPVTAKAALRKRIKAELKGADAAGLAEQSTAICSHVRELPPVADAQCVVAYLACDWLREVDLSGVVTSALNRKIAVFVPKVKDKFSNMAMLRVASLDGLQKVPPFGIVEPTELDESGNAREDLIRAIVVPDVVLLPGLGFDRHGGRLGRGGGYYDKFLSDLMRIAQAEGGKRPLLIGVAFREQITEKVPMAEHDFRCDTLVTADGVQYCA